MSEELGRQFGEWWAAYPKRAGGNPRGKAEKAWNARVREGVDPTALFRGVQAYGLYCDAMGRTRTEYVKQAQFWLSPTYRGWEQDWSLPEEPMSELGFDDGDFADAPLDFDPGYPAP